MILPIFYNAHHSPVGAFATLTLGMKGKQGGFGFELSGPANQNIYIGLEAQQGHFQMLPFYEHGESGTALNDFGIAPSNEHGFEMHVIPDAEISREMGASVDTWKTSDFQVSFYSPYVSDELDDSYLPAIYAELTLTNSSQVPKRWIFGFEQNHPQLGVRPIQSPGAGIQNGLEFGFATDDSTAKSGTGFEPGMILNPRLDINNQHMLGNTGVIYGEVPAGETKIVRLVFGWYRNGIATSGLATKYSYATTYDDLGEILHGAWEQFDQAVLVSKRGDEALKQSVPDDARRFQIAHAIRSYYGSTQCLVTQSPLVSEPERDLWVVNEGEYRMMNTLDLTADMAFFEMDQHDWTVPNVLEWFRDRYSYTDDIVKDGVTVPGGVTFTHDMGVTNQFSREQFSSYERAGYDDCFSYMSVEELMNWLGVASLYSVKKDLDWGRANLDIFKFALESLLRRDHPEAEKRQGYIQWDSSRCEGGAEITTYDSLDTSLGQSRGSAYLAIKMFGICLVLQKMFLQLEEPSLAEMAGQQAELCSQAIQTRVSAEGVIPAVFEGETDSVIIPIIEGLIWPMEAGQEDDLREHHSELLSVLRTHLLAVLKPGICKFEDGGWKLSSTSDNSWLSKIYVCQYISEVLLGLEPDHAADIAHVYWLTNSQSGYFAWSDQMVCGVAIGSKYYPRGVTAWLWARHK